MSDYLGYELAKADTEFTDAETNYDFHCAKMYLTIKASNKKFAVLADVSTEKLKRRMDECNARFKMLSAIVEGQDKRYKALSRELTRRGMDFERRNKY